jgi:hypothetical protein
MVADQPSQPCYNSFRKIAEDEFCIVGNYCSVLLATDHWPLITAPWISTNSKLSSK